MQSLTSALSDLAPLAGQDAQLELFCATVLLAPATRTVTACYDCGAEVEPDALGCDLHPGAALVPVTLWRPVVALGMTGVCTEGP